MTEYQEDDGVGYEKERLTWHHSQSSDESLFWPDWS